MDECGAGEICAYAVAALILGQYFIYCDGNNFPIPVPEPETHWRDFPICVCAGNHLYRNINT